MASREGTVVLLEDLIREATRRALDIVKVKNPDLSAEAQQSVAQAVAIGAIRYPMISRENAKDVTFDWESALNFDGQAAPYIQYAQVRANSILRKAGGSVPPALTPTHELSRQEIALVDLIARFPREVQRAAAELSPMVIANLTFELAQAFNDFTINARCFRLKNRCAARLRLTAATRQAIINGLALLGITAPQAM